MDTQLNPRPTPAPHLGIPGSGEPGSDWTAALASGRIEVALDTEYSEDRTLTTQAAARLDRDTIVTQLYYADHLPTPPGPAELAVSIINDEPGYQAHFTDLVIRPANPLIAAHSPARLLIDLFDWHDLAPVSRPEGVLRLRAAGPRRPVGFGVSRTAVLPRQTLRVVLVAHAWKFDLGRVFGTDWYSTALGPGPGRRLALRHERTPAFVWADGEPAYRPPVVEYLELPGGELVGLRVEFRDTNVMFGPGKLDALGEAFAGVRKAQNVTAEDLADMDRTFRTRPVAAYGYAHRDAVNTLLLYARMEALVRDVHVRASQAPDDPPPVHGTPGRNAFELMLSAAARTAAGSEVLHKHQALKALWRGGGAGGFEGRGGTSEFGAQTAKVQGGLLLSRLPDTPRLLAPGMIRDVDMERCYPTVLRGMAVYVGRPVVFEPGRRDWTLAQAAEFAAEAADPDAWFIRVTGDLPGGLNVLLSSPEGAVTRDCFRRQKPTAVEDVGASRVYSHRVESAVVTWHTWQVIRHLPPPLRREYERLRAETLVLYPRDFTATDGPGFDARVRDLRTGLVDWEQRLDLRGRRLTTVRHLDEQYVTLRVPLGDLVDRLVDLRRRAQAAGGRGLAAAAKLLANSMYGVLAGLTTGNVVAAQCITGAVRAEVYLIAMALNAAQVVTDGVIYARDRIPAGDFAACLRKQADYPFRMDRSDAGLEYLPAAAVPTDDREFGAFVRARVDRFFAPGAAALLAHDLAHKAHGPDKVTAFDAVLTDAPGNYVLACGEGEVVRPVGIAVDATGRHRDRVVRWMCECYAADRVTNLPPAETVDRSLGWSAAVEAARRAERAGQVDVRVPVGWGSPQVHSYHAVKPSAQVYRTPRQHRTVQKALARFQARTGCGVEVVALRPAYGDRPAGSLEYLNSTLYDLARDGKSDLGGTLQLNRFGAGLQAVLDARAAELGGLRKAANEAFRARLGQAAGNPTGIPVAAVAG